MFWLCFLFGVLVVLLGGGFIVCILSVFEVEEDFPRDKIGNIILRKSDDVF